MVWFGLYQAVLRRSMRDLSEGELGLEIFSQILAERKFGSLLSLGSRCARTQG
jgi:hypothetical protein